MGLRADTVRWKSFLLGAVSAFLITACAGVGFAYKFYGLQLASYKDGKLLGPTPSDDLPISECEPDAASQGKCVCMISPEFFRLKTDHMVCEQQLQDCQAPK